MTTQQMIGKFLKECPIAGGGPGHIVLEDGNLRDSDIEFCEKLTKTALTHNAADMAGEYQQDIIEILIHRNWYKDHSRAELWATLFFLHELSKIPENIRENDDETEGVKGKRYA